VTIGQPDRVILRVARNIAADIIVMGAHGKGALDRRLLLGSTTHPSVDRAKPAICRHFKTGHFQ
jgi:hypothetical protein